MMKTPGLFLSIKPLNEGNKVIKRYISGHISNNI